MFQFHFKHSKQKHGAKQTARAYVRSQLKKKQQEAELKELWLNGQSQFDRDRYIQQWEQYRAQYAGDILDLALKTMAIGNSVVDVNHALKYNMGMQKAEINSHFINTALKKLFNVSLVQMLLNDSSLDKKVKQSILERALAREFPLKHERAPAAPINNTPPNVQELMRGLAENTKTLRTIERQRED